MLRLEKSSRRTPFLAARADQTSRVFQKRIDEVDDADGVVEREMHLLAESLDTGPHIHRHRRGRLLLT